MGLKHVWIGLLDLHCLSASNSVFRPLHLETNPLLYVASSSKCWQKCPWVYFTDTLFNAGDKIEILQNRWVRRNRSNNCTINTKFNGIRQQARAYRRFLPKTHCWRRSGSHNLKMEMKIELHLFTLTVHFSEEMQELNSTQKRNRLRRSAVGNIERARSRTLKMTIVIGKYIQSTKYGFLLYFSMDYRDFSVKSKLIISLFQAEKLSLSISLFQKIGFSWNSFI